MAFHRGDMARLKDFLRRDPGLIERRFSCLEIYPPELGCAKDGRSGMHWTPIDGTTLLHLAIDFDDEDIFKLLLAHGADVNARANMDASGAEGFGGHTPIYSAVVSHGKHQGAMAGRLLESGASTTVRASLRKFLDWCETPRWHEARDAGGVGTHLSGQRVGECGSAAASRFSLTRGHARRKYYNTIDRHLTDTFLKSNCRLCENVIAC
jgi:hypothetical protein